MPDGQRRKAGAASSRDDAAADAAIRKALQLRRPAGGWPWEKKKVAPTASKRRKP